MYVQEAIDIIHTSNKDTVRHTEHSEDVLKEARLVILKDAYEFLESENFHSAITVIEDLTGIGYV